MTGPMRRNAEEILETLDTAATRIKRALRDRQDSQAQSIRDNNRRVGEADSDLRDIAASVKKGEDTPGAPQNMAANDLPEPNINQRRQLEELEKQGLVEKVGDGTYRMRDPESPTAFNANPNHDYAEVQRQLKLQENGMNRLSVKEFFDNRSHYEAHGRTEKKLQDKYRDMLEKMGFDVSGQAVLHGPDQVAGGYPDRFDGLGDIRVNSAFGGAWPHKISGLQDSIDVSVANIPADLLPHIRLNIKLPLT